MYITWVAGLLESWYESWVFLTRAQLVRKIKCDSNAEHGWLLLRHNTSRHLCCNPTVTKFLPTAQQTAQLHPHQSRL